MKIGPLHRARAVIGAPALEALLATGPLRRLLARPRSSPVDGQTCDEHIAAMLRLDDLTNESEIASRTPEVARRRVASEIPIVDAPFEGGVTTRAVEWVAPTGLRAARLYVPDELDTPAPGLIYVHGGGWVTGDLDTHDSLCRKLASLGKLRVLAIDYRLAPEHPFPAPVEDAVAAYRWAVEHASALGMEPTRIGIGGDSAGGNLGAVVGLKCARDPVPPALTLLLYPALDATLSQPSQTTLGEGWFLTNESIEWYLGHYLSGRADLRRHPDVSPLLAPSVSGAARASIYPVHFDPLRDEAFRYAERLREAGVEVHFHCFETLIHGFALMTRACPAAARAVERIAREVGEALREPR